MELEAHGRLGASVRFDGHTVTLTRTNRSLPGYGERSVHVSQLAGVRWQPPGLLTREGFIGFTVAGTVAPRARVGSQTTAARLDEWHVPFWRKERPAFEALRAAVEEARRSPHGPAAGAPTATLDGTGGPLVELARMLREGLLTREEFEQEKARLLRR
jgi:hypothetical protein